MKNHIAEDLPARKFAPAAAGSAPVDKNNKKENSGKTPEERAKQAVYDIRYKARREDIPLRQAYSEYMQNSSMAGQERNMVKAKLFGKEGGGMKAEDFNPIFKNVASDNVAKALFKVFVEKKEINIEDLKEFYSRLNSKGERIFHVRITDRKTGKSYTDDVTREKINRLRANPNILSVEMTEYRPPSESQRTSNTNTARVTAGKGLDYDGDGKVESGAKEYRGAVHNAIQRKKGGVANGKDTSGVKEEFIHEDETEDSNSKKIDVMKKGKKNKVNTSPTQGGNERVGLMAHNELEGELIAETGYSKFLKKVKEEMECGSDDKKKKNEVDNRSLATKINIAKNIVRASTGIKNPMVMVSNGEDVKEGLGLSVGISKIAGKIGENPRTSAEQGAKNFQKNVADPVGRAVKGAVRSIVQPANNSPEAKKARENKYRPEEIEFTGELVDEIRTSVKMASEDYMRVNSDGSRERVAGDPPKAKLKRKPLGHTSEQKRQMNKQPKTDYRARPGESD